MFLSFFIFFFSSRRRHTRSLCDWSSDVCSSDLFLNAVDHLPNPRAQMVRRDGRWETISSKEFLRRAAGLSSVFVELGVRPGDRVGLFSTNRPEWHTADFAINGAGAITVPVYFNESPDRMTYILKHCGAKVVFVAGTAD